MHIEVRESWLGVGLFPLGCRFIFYEGSNSSRANEECSTAPITIGLLLISWSIVNKETARYFSYQTTHNLCGDKLQCGMVTFGVSPLCSRNIEIHMDLGPHLACIPGVLSHFCLLLWEQILGASINPWSLIQAENPDSLRCFMNNIKNNYRFPFTYVQVIWFVVKMECLFLLFYLWHPSMTLKLSLLQLFWLNRTYYWPLLYHMTSISKLD